VRAEELSALLRSPALSLEPPPDLLEGVRRGARRTRRGQRAAVAALSGTAVLVAALAVPALLDARGGPPSTDVADTLPSELAARIDGETTSVELLESLNGGRVVTYFQGTRWCTAAMRTVVNDGCRGYVGAGTLGPFALLLPSGHETLSVDRDSVVAGVLGTGVERVTVELSDGTTEPASAVSGRGFPRPVWWAAVPRGTTVVSYTARGPGDVVVERLPVGQPSPRSSSE
jgi:hypothetical protein